MEKDKEPKGTFGAATKKPKQGRHANTGKKKGPKKPDSGGSDSNQSDMGSQTSAASEWDRTDRGRGPLRFGESVHQFKPLLHGTSAFTINIGTMSDIMQSIRVKLWLLLMHRLAY